MSQSASDIFQRSVSDVARERFNQFSRSSPPQVPTADNPGGIAREMIRYPGFCLAEYASEVFNRLLHVDPMSAAKKAIEVEAFRPFCDLVFAAGLEPKSAREYRQSYVRLTVNDIPADLQLEVSGLLNEIALDYAVPAAEALLKDAPRGLD